MEIIIRTTKKMILVAARTPYGFLGRIFSIKHHIAAKEYLAKLETAINRNARQAA